MTARRRRKPDIGAVLASLSAAGFEPQALDILPDGTYRWHLSDPRPGADAELDRELEEFGKRHGNGHA